MATILTTGKASVHQVSWCQSGRGGGVADGFAMPLSAKRLNSRHGVERGWAWKEHYPRESKDTPSEKAFCLVAPTVLLSDLAILLAGVFCFARLFSSRTSVAVHARLLAFLAMLSSQLRLIQTIGVNNGFSAEMSICSADKFGVHSRAALTKMKRLSHFEPNRTHAVQQNLLMMFQ